MITTCKVYTDFRGIVNTWQQSHFRPASFETALHLASMEMFNIRRRALGNNQDITDELRPFLTSVQIAISDFARGGIIRYPLNYSRFEELTYFSAGEDQSAVGVPCKGVPKMAKNGRCRPLREEEKAEAQEKEKLVERGIDKIASGKWASCLEHAFLGPSETNAVCSQTGEGFIVKPEGIGYVVLYYLAIPERPKFAYKKDEKHNIICIPEQCKNLLWNDELYPELMARLKTYYGSFNSNERKYNEGKKDTADAQ